ncbi:MAG: thiamine phosphate synthase [Acidobacteriota bacterium]
MIPSPPHPFRLLAISDARARRPFGDLASWCDALAATWRRGAPASTPGLAVQIRDKDAGDAARLALARTARARLAPHGIGVWLNGRIDLARAAGADGVHLPAAGVPLAVVRPHAAAHALGVGVAGHDLDDVDDARRDGADYSTFGPIFPTPSKPDRDADAMPGPDGLRAAVARAGALPLIALGGLDDVARCDAAIAAGAAAVAGIRLFHDLDALQQLRDAAATLPWQRAPVAAQRTRATA